MSKPWASAEERKLRKLVNSEMPRLQVYEQFPHRSIASVRAKIKLMGLNTKRHWTPEEDALLLKMWETLVPWDEIQKTLKRGPLSVYGRAVHHFRLKGGCPPGWETLTGASERVGTTTFGLRRMLAEAGYKVHPAFSPSRAEADAKAGTGRRFRGHHNVVRPYEVDDAIKRRDSTETLQEACDKRGIYPRELKAWLASAGIVPKDRKRGTYWRIPTRDIDRIVSDREAERRACESVTAAAERHGTTKETLGPWLREAGVRYTRGMVEKRIVDKIVAKKFADPFCKASPKYHTPEGAAERAAITRAKRRQQVKDKIAAMTPEQLKVFREKVATRARERMRRVRAAAKEQSAAA